jgi:DNA-binding NarL/FixJ family response regulator
MLNAMLKPIVKALVDGEKAVAAGIAKDWSALGQAGVAVLMDIPALIAGAPQFEADLQALLVDPAADADLLAYVVLSLEGQDEKAKKIIAAAADLLLSTVVKTKVLVEAVKS